MGFLAGLASSQDGVRWQRDCNQPGEVQSSAPPGEAGRVLGPNPDWWWHDTRHVSVSDVQAKTDAVLRDFHFQRLYFLVLSGIRAVSF